MLLYFFFFNFYFFFYFGGKSISYIQTNITWNGKEKERSKEELVYVKQTYVWRLYRFKNIMDNMCYDGYKHIFNKTKQNKIKVKKRATENMCISRRTFVCIHTLFFLFFSSVLFFCFSYLFLIVFFFFSF